METFLAEWERVRERARDDSQKGSLGEDQANGANLPGRSRFVSEVCGKLVRRSLRKHGQSFAENRLKRFTFAVLRNSRHRLLCIGSLVAQIQQCGEHVFFHSCE